MIQVNSKIVSFLIGSALIIGIALPTITLGEVGGGANFCANINNYFTNYYTVVQQKVAILNTKIANSQADINARRTQKDTNLSEARTAAATSKITYYANLQAAATTDAEKTAVTTFETAVNNATATKQAAIDAATATYRNGVNVVIAQKEPIIQSAAPTFEAAVNTVLSTAKTSCANGTSSVTAFTTAKAGVKTAIEQFKVVVQYGGAINTQMMTLQSTRNAAYQKANSDYRIAVQTAANALNTAFGTAVQ